MWKQGRDIGALVSALYYKKHILHSVLNYYWMNYDDFPIFFGTIIVSFCFYDMHPPIYDNSYIIIVILE